jgi:hypothetical protein
MYVKKEWNEIKIRNDTIPMYYNVMAVTVLLCDSKN